MGGRDAGASANRPEFEGGIMHPTGLLTAALSGKSRFCNGFGAGWVRFVPRAYGPAGRSGIEGPCPPIDGAGSDGRALSLRGPSQIDFDFAANPGKMRDLFCTSSRARWGLRTTDHEGADAP